MTVTIGFGPATTPESDEVLAPCVLSFGGVKLHLNMAHEVYYIDANAMHTIWAIHTVLKDADSRGLEAIPMSECDMDWWTNEQGTHGRLWLRLKEEHLWD